MLKGIKSMILEKQEYLEAAQIIFEDAAHGGIDDLIILNESAEVPEDDEKEIDPDHDGDDDLEKGDDDDKKQDDEEDDLTNIPLDGDKEPLEDGDNPDKGSELEGDDLLAASIDDEAIGAGTLSPGDDLPPVNDGIDDFLNVSIDLRSNTITDVLPVPPDNAGEAIADDILETRVDSGFQEDATPAPAAPVQSSDPAGAAAGFPMDEGADDILNESIDNETKEAPTDTGETVKESVDDILNESWDPNKFDKSQLGNVNQELAGLKKIGNTRLFTKEELDKFNDVVANHKSSLPGDFKRSIDAIMEKQKEFKKAGKKIEESVDSFLEAITLDGGGEEKPADGTEPTDGGTADDPGDPPPAEGGENEVTSAVKDKVAEADAPIDGGAPVTGGKEALLKKLGSLTKGLEDAKKAVMDTIQ